MIRRSSSKALLLFPVVFVLWLLFHASAVFAVGFCDVASGLKDLKLTEGGGRALDAFKAEQLAALERVAPRGTGALSEELGAAKMEALSRGLASDLTLEEKAALAGSYETKVLQELRGLSGWGSIRSEELAAAELSGLSSVSARASASMLSSLSKVDIAMTVLAFVAMGYQAYTTASDPHATPLDWVSLGTSMTGIGIFFGIAATVYDMMDLQKREKAAREAINRLNDHFNQEGLGGLHSSYAVNEAITFRHAEERLDEALSEQRAYALVTDFASPNLKVFNENTEEMIQRAKKSMQDFFVRYAFIVIPVLHDLQEEIDYLIDIRNDESTHHAVTLANQSFYKQDTKTACHPLEEKDFILKTKAERRQLAQGCLYRVSRDFVEAGKNGNLGGNQGQFENFLHLYVLTRNHTIANLHVARLKNFKEMQLDILGEMADTIKESAYTRLDELREEAVDIAKAEFFAAAGVDDEGRSASRHCWKRQCLRLQCDTEEEWTKTYVCNTVHYNRSHDQVLHRFLTDLIDRRSKIYSVTENIRENRLQYGSPLFSNIYHFKFHAIMLPEPKDTEHYGQELYEALFDGERAAMLYQTQASTPFVDTYHTDTQLELDILQYHGYTETRKELVQLMNGIRGHVISLYDKFESFYDIYYNSGAFHTWGDNGRHATVGDLFLYDNPNTGDQELFELKSSLYWYFPIDKTSTRGWHFISTTRARGTPDRKLHVWGGDDREGIVNNTYEYNNPYTGDRELFRLKRLLGGKYWYFPINKSDNYFWEYIGLAPNSDAHPSQ